MEEKDNNNQELIDTEQAQPWEIKNSFLREAKQQAVKSACQQITGINAKTWFELEKKGVLPASGSYEVYIQKLVKYFQHKQEVAIEKARLQAEKDEKEAAMPKKRSTMVFETESGFSPIQEAEIIQKIRVNKARERQLHLANMLTSKEMLSREKLLELTGPMVGNIANILRQTAEEEPAAQKVIDKCFESLHKMGQILLQQCNEDEAAYIDLLSETPVNIAQMLDKGVNVY